MSRQSNAAKMEKSLVIFVICLPLFDVVTSAWYNCSIINVNITSESNSATITWDTTPDCDKEGSIFALLHLIRT